MAEGESADTRLVDAVQALAKAEGLVCHTQEELAVAKARLQPPIARASALADMPIAPAERIAACVSPQHQTALWRCLTPMEKIATMKGR